MGFLRRPIRSKVISKLSDASEVQFSYFELAKFWAEQFESLSRLTKVQTAKPRVNNVQFL